MADFWYELFLNNFGDAPSLSSIFECANFYRS